MTYKAIGEAIGISAQAAHAHVRAALASPASSSGDPGVRDAERKLEEVRLDAITRAHWGKRHDPRSAKILLEVAARRARLRDLDAATRVEATGTVTHAVIPAPADAEGEYDLDRLSVAELRELQRLLARAERRPIRLVVPPTVPGLAATAVVDCTPAPPPLALAPGTDTTPPPIAGPGADTEAEEDEARARAFEKLAPRTWGPYWPPEES